MGDRRRLRRVRASAMEFDPEMIGRLSAEAGQQLDGQPDRSRRVLRAMQRCWSEVLTPTQRRYLEAYYQQRRTMRQIAESNGVNIATVSRTLKRARVRLRAVLKYYLERDI